MFWNIILYFKVIKLPVFFLDLDYSDHHMKVHVSQIRKFLPLEKKNPLNQFRPKQAQLNQDALKKLNEESPARKSSIHRVASSVVDKFKRSNSKVKETESDMGEKDSVMNDNTSNH